MNPNTGHGHVFPRPDGVKARCGGPGICKQCNEDLAAQLAGHGPQPCRAMQPSMGLRWLERAEPVPGAEGFMQTVKVLQQGWAPVQGGQVEWIDVPTVKA